MSDALSAVLDALRLEGTLYFSTEFTSPWGVRVPTLGRVARFHLVVRGRTWVRVEDGPPPELLEPGDLVVVPHGAAHTLSDDPKRPCVDVDRAVEESGFTGSGAFVYGGEDEGNPTRLVCGHFALDPDLDHPLLEGLPPAIVIRREETEGQPHFAEVFRFVSREARSENDGSHAIVRRLSEVLFIQALRTWATRPDTDRGPMGAVGDPRLGRSLIRIHEEPQAPWTLDGLAREAGLSRTTFAERFRERVGMTPMQYLAFWRMQRARALLVETDLTLEAVAERVGYHSAPAFHRVFKRWLGRSPGAYRRDRRQRPELVSPR